MIINEPKVEISGDVARLSALIEAGGENKLLWFEVPAEYGQYLVHERSDAFLAAVLMLAMKSGDSIRVKGVLSRKLFYNLQNYYMHLLTILMPHLKKVEIICDQLDDGEAFKSGRGVLMGFSGGVDSFAAVHDHFLDGDEKNYRVTHLIFNKVNDSEASESNEAQYNKLSSFATEQGVPYFKIDTNMHEFNDIPFVASFLIRNAAAVMAVQKLVNKYIIASSYKYQDIYVGNTYSMGYSESVTAPLLSTDNMETIISGAQYTRVQKTAFLTEIPSSKKYLDVCVSSDRGESTKNCSACFKCLRTAFTLEILGALDDYAEVFDLEVYRKKRFKYAARVLRKTDKYDEEIYQLAKQKGYKFTALERLWATSVFYFLRKALK